FIQQLGFAPASEVMDAGAQWLVEREKGVSLSEVMRARGAIDTRQVQLVDALVNEAIAAHGGDASVTLDSLPMHAQHVVSTIDDTLKPDLSGEKREPVSTASFDSLETPENIGVEARGRYTFDTGKKGRTEELGKGGAGRVVVARDHFLGRDVALKELHREITQSEKFDTLHVRNLEARFLREARVTGQLEHPAIVPVYELGRRRDGTMYYTMRRVRGRTLAQALGDTRSLEGRLALLPDLLTACRAVAAAHHRDVVHRDLKPQNVMLGPHGETYVMDWGLARVMGRVERSRTSVQLAPDLTGGRDLGPVGTPSYMSPEQAHGNRDELDARSDVWGLGAMLFELITGRAPYLGRSPWDVLAEVRSRPPPRVASLQPTAPPELIAVCEKALAWNRDHRYADAGQLAADLDAFLQGKRVKAYEYSSREVARRVLKRHQQKALLFVITLVALLGLAGFSAVQVRRERDEARKMARFFLAEVAPTLATVPGSADISEQLSHSALEVFAADVDPLRGAKEDRLLLARTWNDIAHAHWATGKIDDSRAELERARVMLEPLVETYPDDPEVLAVHLTHQLWSADLLMDESKLDEALRILEARLEPAQRMRALAPGSYAVLKAYITLLSRIAWVRGQRGEPQLGLEVQLRARDAAADLVRTFPNAPAAAMTFLDESTATGKAQLAVGQRKEGLASLRAVAAQAVDLRAKRDTRDLQAAHANLLGMLARALHPVDDAVEREKIIREGRSLYS
ncbi:MAG TPA: protein kinase, partial [Archangium sp.]